MAIAAMKKLTLAAPVDSRAYIISEMMRIGCVEVEELNRQSVDYAELFEQGLIRLDAGEADRILARRDKIAAACGLLDRYAPVKTGMFAPKPAVHEFALFDEGAEERAVAAAETLITCSNQLDRNKGELRTLASDEALLAPWSELKTPMEFTGGSSFAYRCGTLPAYLKLEQLRMAFQETAPCTELWEVSRDKAAIYVAVLTDRDEDGEALRLLRQYSFAEQSFKGFTGTAAEKLAQLAAAKAKLEKERDAVLEQIRSMQDKTQLLKQAYDALTNRAERERVRAGLIETGSAFILEGWFPEKAEKDVVALMERCEASYSIEEPEEEDDVPVRLDNGRLVEPFGEITQMYGMPAYRSYIDPNPTMALFYFLAFGIMLSDAAYGILLALGCLFMLVKTKPSGSMRRMLTIFFFGGISTLLWGAVFGSWFGNAVPVITGGLFGKEITPPALIDPINEPLKMMILSYIFGGVQVMTAMFLDALRRLKRGDWQGAVFGIFSWYVLFAGIGLIFLVDSSAGMYVAAAGALMVMYGGSLEKKGLAKISGGFMALYNITGFFSDILSYSRLLALCLSTAVVANVVNTMGSLKGFSVSGTILFVVVFVIGHIFNLALNLLGTYVHTSRLQYIEYFGRFYEGGGRMFKPLAVTTKYVDIIKED